MGHYNHISLKDLENQISLIECLRVKLIPQTPDQLFTPYPYQRPLSMKNTLLELKQKRIQKHYPDVDVQFFHFNHNGELPDYMRLSVVMRLSY